MCNAEEIFSLVRDRVLDRDAERRQVHFVVASNCSTDLLFATDICAPNERFKSKAETRAHGASGHARRGARSSGRGRTSPKSGALAWPHLGVRREEDENKHEVAQRSGPRGPL